MRIYFVRHGEPDYGALGSPRLGSRAHDIAPLTHIGRIQIETIARDYRLADVQAVIGSSYARALESAALLARALGRPFYVEVDLHEWRAHPDPGQELDPELLRLAGERLRQGDDPGDGPWESLAQVRERAIAALARYRRFERIAVVTHGVLIAAVVGARRPIEHAEIVPYDLDAGTAPASLSEPVPEGRG